MTGILLSFSAAIFYSLRGYFTKKLTEFYDASFITAVSRGLSIIPIVIAVIFFVPKITINAPPILLLTFVAIIIFGSIANIFQVKATAYLPVSTLSSVSQIGIFFTAVISGLLLKEFPSPPEFLCIIGIVAITASIAAPSTSIKEVFVQLRKNKGFLYVVLSQIMYASSGVFIRYWTQIDDPFIITFLSSIGFTLLPLPTAIRKERSSFNLRTIFSLPMLALSFVTGVAMILNFLAKKYAYAAETDAILSSSILFSTAIGFFVLHEKFNPRMYAKFVAVMAGIVVLAIL